MELLPLFFKGASIHCLVIGGGALALRKLRLLVDSGARCVVIASEFHDNRREFVVSNNIQFEERSYRDADLNGMNLVICATDDNSLNTRIGEQCISEGIFVNVVDDANLSTAVFPSVIDRSPVMVAVSSGATSPVKARRIR